MNEPVILWSSGSVQVTAYSLCVVLAALLGVLITLYRCRKLLDKDSALNLCLWVIPGALLGARIFYCATMFNFIVGSLGDAWFMVQLWQGGYNVYGGIAGGLLAAALFARFSGKAKMIPAVLDVLAPGAAAAICVIRLAEVFTGQGLGAYIDAESMMCFPFGVPSLYGDYQVPVFFYEALAAAVVAVVTACRKGKQAGDTAEWFLTMYSLTQIILESWRQDEFIRFGFVRFNMIAAAVTLAVVLGLRIRKSMLSGTTTVAAVVRSVVFAVCAGIVILIEFALDKSSISNILLYIVMAVTLVVMGIVILMEKKSVSNQAN